MTNSTLATQRLTDADPARSLDPLRANPITSLVASIRAMQDDPTPRQREMRERNERRVDALLATGLYSLAPAH